MATLAGATTRLKFGMNAVVASLRDPLRRSPSSARRSTGSRTDACCRCSASAPTTRPSSAPPAATPRSAASAPTRALELCRRLWSEERVTFRGEYYRYEDASISPRPIQQPLPLWIGGSSPAAIRRTVRLGTGWLAGIQTPAQVKPVVEAIKAHGAETGRPIPADHYGASFVFRLGPGDDAVASRAFAARARAGGRGLRPEGLLRRRRGEGRARAHRRVPRRGHLEVRADPARAGRPGSARADAKALRGGPARRARLDGLVLNKLDDYPIHQTPEPVAHPATGDRNAYDRYWFNGFTREADLFFAVAFGVYPNRRVMDAAISVVRGGLQYVVRGSRLAPDERTDTRAGPIAVEVVEPMRTIRVRIDPNPHGIEGELRLPRAHGSGRRAALHTASGHARDHRQHALHPVRHLGRLARRRRRADQARRDARARHTRPVLGCAARRRAGTRNSGHEPLAVLLALGAAALRRPLHALPGQRGRDRARVQRARSGRAAARRRPDAHGDGVGTPFGAVGERHAPRALGDAHARAARR